MLNPSIFIGLTHRTQNLIPITREAIIFGANRNVLLIDEQGNLNFGSNHLKKPSWNRDKELDSCYRASIHIGKWFAQSGSPSTILTMLGIKP